MESGLRARASEARAIRARWRVGKSKRKVTSKNSLFHHHHHPNFYDFFPRAIAPFTGKMCCYSCSDHVAVVFVVFSINVAKLCSGVDDNDLSSSK